MATDWTDEEVRRDAPSPKGREEREVKEALAALDRLRDRAAVGKPQPAWEEVMSDAGTVRDALRRLRTHSPEEPVGWPRVVADFLAWAEETFPEATPSSCVAHLRSEVEELSDTPEDPEELADAAMLIFHAAYRADVDLISAMRSKLEKNRAREWGPKNAEGFREHVRTPIGQALDSEEGSDG